jgi:hypothetical protein
MNTLICSQVSILAPKRHPFKVPFRIRGIIGLWRVLEAIAIWNWISKHHISSAHQIPRDQANVTLCEASHGSAEKCFHGVIFIPGFALW